MKVIYVVSGSRTLHADAGGVCAEIQNDRRDPAASFAPEMVSHFTDLDHWITHVVYLWGRMYLSVLRLLVIIHV